MNDFNPHIDFEGLVASYLAGSASPRETELLENLVRSDEQKRKSFIEIKKAWMLAATAPANFDSKGAWEKIASHTQNIPIRPLNTTTSKSLIYKIAAALALLIIGFYSAWYYAYRSDKTLVAQSQPDGIELHDGSKVTVNRGSTITYPRRFSGNERRVVLQGEAFFEVARDVDKVFVVEVQGVEVRVLGTSFNIKSITGDATVEVSVHSGRVALVAAGRPELIISAGETGIYRKSDDALVKEEVINPNVIAWMTRELVFENTELKEVFEVIKNTYGFNVALRDAHLVNCKLTASFVDKPLDDVLNIISETFNLTYVSSEGVIWATGEGCF